MLYSKEIQEDANKVIHQHILYAIGSGFIPFPLVDAIAIAGIELRMIDKLSKVYHFPFPNRLAFYKMVISLLGTIAPVYITNHYPSLFKNIPIIGYSATVGMLSITGGVSVFVVGKIFQEHFESGGTFLGGNKKVIQQFAKDEYQRGKKIVPQLIMEQHNNTEIL